MIWLFDLHETQPIAHAVAMLACVCVLGMTLGSLKSGIGLGTAGVLFAGILVGHFGQAVDHHTLDFVKEFGLILFVFTIGLQLGPGFFAALRQQGMKLNALAAAIVLLGAIAAPLAGWLGQFDRAAVLGIFSGASTNTPSLGAGTQTLGDASRDRARSARAAGAGVCGHLSDRDRRDHRHAARAQAALSREHRCASREELAARARRKPSRSSGGRSSSPTRTSTACARDAFPAASRRASPSRACVTAGKRTPPPTRRYFTVMTGWSLVGTRAGLDQFERVVGRRTMKTSRSPTERRHLSPRGRDRSRRARQDGGRAEPRRAFSRRGDTGDARGHRDDGRAGAAAAIRRPAPDRRSPRRSRQAAARRRQLAEGAQRNTLHSVLHRHRARRRARSRCRSAFPGLPHPVRLGLAGGRSSWRCFSAGSVALPTVWHMPVSTNLAFREFGIALFFGAVGLERRWRILLHRLHRDRASMDACRCRS